GGAVIANFGIGLFVQKTPLDYDYQSRSYTITRTNFGPDVYGRLTIIPFIKPYARIGLSAYEYASVKGAGQTKTNKKYFNTYYAGVGVGLQPAVPVVDFMIFGEYLYNKRFKGGNLIGHTINVGVSLGI
ncbi:MAG TPA: outer membrane beta-barrel protein, partial [Spirochaetota bacterium]